MARRTPAKRSKARGIPGGGQFGGVTNVTGTAREPGLGRQNPPKGPGRIGKSVGPTTVTLIGPLWDGSVDTMIDDMLAEMVEVAAAQGFADVMTSLNEHIQFPTPYYETQINIARDGRALVVNDRDIVYGPWLEGVSSRNKRTRFKGYASFRRSAANLRRKLPELLAPVAARWTARFNGR
jgi:hypothetical protein